MAYNLIPIKNNGIRVEFGIGQVREAYQSVMAGMYSFYKNNGFYQTKIELRRNMPSFGSLSAGQSKLVQHSLETSIDEDTPIRSGSIKVNFFRAVRTVPKKSVDYPASSAYGTDIIPVYESLTFWLNSKQPPLPGNKTIKDADNDEKNIRRELERDSLIDYLVRNYSEIFIEKK